jgi:hypothetical protein
MDFDNNWITQFIFAILFIFFMFYNPVICPLMLGVLLLFYAINSVLFLNKLSKNGIESFGKILSYESDRKGYKTPIIEFQIAEGKYFAGKPYVHSSSDLDKFQSYSENINKRVKVIYNPESPEKFILKDGSNGCGIIILIIVGLVLSAISIGNLIGYNDIF